MAYLAYPTDEKKFIRRFPNLLTIHGLEEERQAASGSNWGIEHLEACRVLIPKPDNLQRLESYMPEAKTRVGADPEILAALKGLSAKDVRSMCRQDFYKFGGAFECFYSALANVIREPDEESLGVERARSTRSATVAIPPGRYKE